MRRSHAAVIGAILVVIGAVLSLTRPRRPALDPPAILSEVRQLSQLATVEYTVQKVVGLKERKQPVGSESILLILQARVQAGVDLASLKEDDIQVRSDGSVVVQLPPAKVLNVIVDEKETKVWDRQKTWWTPWVPYSLDLEQRARNEGIDAIRKAALEMGILGQAERNAQSSIQALLSLAGAKAVLVMPAASS